MSDDDPSTQPVQAEKNGYIAGLTAVRGIAALWVVTFHIYGHDELAIVSRGYLGVDLFFILSGFVLSHSSAGRSSSLNWSEYCAFIRARAERIFPLNWLVLAVLALLLSTLPGFGTNFSNVDERFSVASFIACGLLVQNWALFLPTAWNPPAWSLSAEWLAYLTYPITQRLASLPASTLACYAWAALLIAAVAGVYAARGIPDFDVTGTPGTVRMFSEFVAGSILYRAYRQGGRFPPQVTLLSLFASIAAAWLGWLLISDTLVAIAFLGVISIAARTQELKFARPLRRFIIELGEASFSIYLTHVPVIWAVSWIFNETAAGIPAIWLSASQFISGITIGILAHRIFERPLHTLSRNARLRRDVLRRKSELHAQGTSAGRGK